MSADSVVPSEFALLIRSVSALLIGVSILGLASGTLFGLIGLRLATTAASQTGIGFVMSAYFAGLLAGSLTGARVIDRVGHIRAFAVFAAIAAITTLLLPLTAALSAWGLLRAVTGYCMAGLFMTAESWLNHRTVNRIRGRTFGVYAMLSRGAVAVGPLFLNLGDPKSFQLFTLAAILFTASLLPVALTRADNPYLGERRHFGLRRLAEISPVGVSGCLTVGVVNSAFFGMGAVYAAHIGLGRAHVSGFLTIALVGGLVTQFPISALSDKIDRRRLMLAMTLIAAVVAAAIALVGSRSYVLLLALSFLLSGLTLPLYALSVAWTNDFLEPRDFIAASGGLLLAYSLGASAGPLTASAAMTAFGPSGLYFLSAGALAVFAGLTIYRMRQRQAPPVEEQGEVIPMPQMTPAASALDPRAEPAASANAPAASDDAPAEGTASSSASPEPGCDEAKTSKDPYPAR